MTTTQAAYAVMAPIITFIVGYALGWLSEGIYHWWQESGEALETLEAAQAEEDEFEAAFEVADSGPRHLWQEGSGYWWQIRPSQIADMFNEAEKREQRLRAYQPPMEV